MAAEEKPKRKPRGRRPTLEEEHDLRLEVVRLRRQGMSTGAIAKKLKMRKERVVSAVAQLHADWRDRVAAEYDTLMAEEIGELYALRATAFESFAKSQTAKNRAGMSKWLELARRVTVDITTLLGLNDREVFELRRAAPTDPDQSRNEEVEIANREEAELLRGDNGKITVANLFSKARQDALSELAKPARSEE